MQNFGNLANESKTIPLLAETSTTLIIKSLETFHRLFLEAETPKAYFGVTTKLQPYLKNALLFDGSPIPFNPLKGEAHKVLEACKAIWDYGKPTVQIDKDFLTAILALKETNGTLFQLSYLFISDTYRKTVISKLKDPVLKHYWELYDSYPEKDQTMISAPILNRLVPLITDKDIRRIISQTTTFETPPILLIDLPRSPRYDLLSALIMPQQTETVFVEHPLVHLGQNTPIFHVDYLGQLPEDLKDKLLNTATIMTTRTGVVDARTLEPHFNLNPTDYITDLPEGTAYVRLDKTYRVHTVPHDLPKTGKKLTHGYRTSPTLDEKTDSFISGLWGTSKTASKKKFSRTYRT